MVRYTSNISTEKHPHIFSFPVHHRLFHQWAPFIFSNLITYFNRKEALIQEKPTLITLKSRCKSSPFPGHTKSCDYIHTREKNWMLYFPNFHKIPNQTNKLKPLKATAISQLKRHCNKNTQPHNIQIQPAHWDSLPPSTVQQLTYVSLTGSRCVSKGSKRERERKWMGITKHFPMKRFTLCPSLRGDTSL